MLGCLGVLCLLLAAAGGLTAIIPGVEPIVRMGAVVEAIFFGTLGLMALKVSSLPGPQTTPDEPQPYVYKPKQLGNPVDETI